jgi:hypothetical protein
LQITTFAIADPTGLLERPHEEPVRLLAALLRHVVVRLPEVDGVDLVERDEVADVDRMRELDVEAVEVLGLDRDEAPLLELERADDVVRSTCSPVSFRTLS